jgi:hypothetical protein
MNRTQPGAADLVAAARRLGPLIRDRRNESERDRRLPAIVLSAMAWNIFAAAPICGHHCGPQLVVIRSL